MKKFTFLFLAGVLVLFSQTAFAQFDKGDKLLNLGIGVNSYYNGGIPLSASFEVGVTDEISVGAGLDFLSHNYNMVGVDYGFSTLYIGGRASYHFSELLKLNVKELDLYAGATVGFRNFTWKDDYNSKGLGNSYGSGVFVGIYAGGRYYFTPKFGGFVELGAGGSSNARIGFAFRF